LFVLLLAGCGHVIAPTATPVATATATPTPTATPRQTPTLARSTLAPTATATPSPTPIIYVVQKGDNLIGIARHYRVPVALLQETNGVTDPRRLQIGQLLVIPRPDAAISTPPPTPTPVAATIQGVYWQQSSSGDLWLLGEVANDSGQMLEQVIVGADLLDGGGQVVAGRQATLLLEMLPVGESAPFVAHFRRVPGVVTAYRTYLLSAMPAFPGNSYFDLAATHILFDHHLPQLSKVSGVIVNRGALTATHIRVLVTLYDGEKQVVAARLQSLPRKTLAPGAETSFSLWLTPLHGPVVSGKVQVSAQKQVMP